MSRKDSPYRRPYGPIPRARRKREARRVDWWRRRMLGWSESSVRRRAGGGGSRWWEKPSRFLAEEEEEKGRRGEEGERGYAVVQDEEIRRQVRCWWGEDHAQPWEAHAPRVSMGTKATKAVRWRTASLRRSGLGWAEGREGEVARPRKERRGEWAGGVEKEAQGRRGFY
jgi:hypothetical protein